MECPVATKGPTYHPRWRAWLIIAIDTGPGAITGPIAMANEKANIASKEEVGMII